MFDKPQAEHKWLEQLVGNWRIEQQCTMPSGATNRTEGQMTCRMIGGLWLFAESSGESDEGDKWTCVMTVGFDPKRNAYMGTFIGSMMSYLWPYEGTLDESRKRLVLDTNGPKMDGVGTSNYRDTIEIISSDHWRFTGELQNNDSTWTMIMDGAHRRQ